MWKTMLGIHVGQPHCGTKELEVGMLVLYPNKEILKTQSTIVGIWWAHNDSDNRAQELVPRVVGG